VGGEIDDNDGDGEENMRCGDGTPSSNVRLNCVGAELEKCSLSVPCFFALLRSLLRGLDGGLAVNALR